MPFCGFSISWLTAFVSSSSRFISSFVRRIASVTCFHSSPFRFNAPELSVASSERRLALSCFMVEPSMFFNTCSTWSALVPYFLSCRSPAAISLLSDCHCLRCSLVQSLVFGCVSSNFFFSARAFSIAPLMRLISCSACSPFTFRMISFISAAFIDIKKSLLSALCCK